MARATRKGSKKYYGGRKHTTRRTKHTKTYKHARRGGKKSGHKKRKHTRRGRKHRGGYNHAAIKDTLAAVGAPKGEAGTSNVQENAFTGTAINLGDKVSRGATKAGNTIAGWFS